MRRRLDTLNVLLALGLIGFAIWAWPRLPDQIPIHFGPDGRPDGWAERGVLSWFGLPAVGLALWGLTQGVREWMVRRPERINLPSGGSLADHPPELHPPVIEHMRSFMALVATELLVVFCLIVAGSYRTAMGGDSQGIMLTVLALALLSGPLLLAVFLVGLQRATAGWPRG